MVRNPANPNASSQRDAFYRVAAQMALLLPEVTTTLYLGSEGLSARSIPREHTQGRRS